MGGFLAKSNGIAYLREPVTQPFIRRKGRESVLVDIDQDTSARLLYEEFGDDAFHGMPFRHHKVVNRLRDFSLLHRRRRHILIKEVNPKAAKFYCERYHPIVLLLIRHPAAVAFSFSRLGWLEPFPFKEVKRDPDAGIWERFGYAYGANMKDALKVIDNYVCHRTLVYEDLALEPEEQFERIFAFLGLAIPDGYGEVIRKYCYSQKAVAGFHQTERMSKEMVFKWQEELSSDAIQMVRRGFMDSGFEFYSDDSDWLRR